MEDVEWILHVPPWGFVKGINRMFCSVYKYCCASKTFPSGKLSPPCCCDVLLLLFAKKKKDIILHFINRRSVCDGRCGAFSANVPQIVIQFRGAALKCHFVLFFFSFLMFPGPIIEVPPPFGGWRLAQKIRLIELDECEWTCLWLNFRLASLKNMTVHNWNIRRPNSHAKFLFSLTEVQ